MKTLKSFAVLLLMFATGLSLSAQNSDKVISQERSVSEFTHVSFDMPAKLIVSQGKIPSVTIEAPESVQGKVKVNVDDNKTLRFDVKTNKLGDIKFYVTAPEISFLSVYGPAVVTGKGAIKAEKMTVEAGDAAEVDLELDVDKLTTDVSGAANVTLKGRAGTHKSTVSGAANLKAEGLQTQKTSIGADGAATAFVDATEELTGYTSGAATLKYKNKPPTYKIEESGAGLSDMADSLEAETEKLDRDIEELEHQHNKDFKDLKYHSQGHHKSAVDFEFIGLDFGINGYLNRDFGFDIPEGRAYMEPNYGRSFGIGIDLFQVGIPLQKKHVTLWLGPGFEVNNYFYKTDYRLVTGPEILNAELTPNATYSYDKNKLTVSWFRIPLVMTFNFKKFNFSLGAIGAIKLQSYTKQEWKEGETTHEQRTFDDFYLNPLKADATFRIGYGPVNLFANYTFTGMFRYGHGPELYPFTAGLALKITNGR